ncbi:hypothetical protein NDK43_30655 [Neobacillus pocheonensis]|uniref:Uncharacterized protein n=1 Tax=Neobacillus pocheonensis TaxID=363869 RepID=A0ABT0WIE8_9BACI|nr:hypothetical protein [Neobacillus pocheonensis]
MNRSKAVVGDMDTYWLHVRKGFIITVEVFKTPKQYKGFASCNKLGKEDVVGTAGHANKKECIQLAIKDLRENELVERYLS